MSDEMTQDVTQVEETTEASSAENQTEETTQEETQEDSNQTTKSVPYDRFKEVISSRKKLEGEIEQLRSELGEIREKSSPQAPPSPQEEQIKQQLNKYLKELGYVSKEELEQQKADDQLQQSIKDLSKKYDGKDGRPKFSQSEVIDYARKNLIGNLEIAYKQMHEAELIDYAVKKALGKTKGIKTETSDGSGSAEVGTSQSDLKNAALGGDNDALQTLIKRSILS